jgi:hypothetical protein
MMYVCRVWGFGHLQLLPLLVFETRRRARRRSRFPRAAMFRHHVQCLFPVFRAQTARVRELLLVVEANKRRPEDAEPPELQHRSSSEPRCSAARTFILRY